MGFLKPKYHSNIPHFVGGEITFPLQCGKDTAIHEAESIPKW